MQSYQWSKFILMSFICCRPNA